MTIDLSDFLATEADLIKVTIDAVKGSAPREVGAFVLVAPNALWGTIGGGQLEYMAIDEARRMLRRGETALIRQVPLGPEIGQCCGGMVTLGFALLDGKGRADVAFGHVDGQCNQPSVFIFGAGHVGRALCRALKPLPLQPVVIDSREAELALLDDDSVRRCSPLPEADVRSAPANSAFIIVTHDHALDFLLAREALLRGDAFYVGMIGSKTKRAKFAHWLRQDLGPDADYCLEDLICPIGAGGSRDKRPSIIAAMVAAELLIVQEAREQIAQMQLTLDD